MGHALAKGQCGAACACNSNPVEEVDELRSAPSISLKAHREHLSERQQGPVTSLLYVERTEMGAGQSSAESTTDGYSSVQSDGGSVKTRTKAMSMLQTAGLGVISVPPCKLDKDRLATFREGLLKAGIDLSRWGCGGAKSVEHLFWETYQQRGCIITGMGEDKIKRVTRLVKIRLIAEILGVDHMLFSRMQFMHDGQTVERKQVPLRKFGWKEMSEEELKDCEMLYQQNCPLTESWKTESRKTLEERLGLTLAWQERHLVEDVEGHRFVLEDNIQSGGYPGLTTTYCIHEVTFRVRDPEHAGVQVIGLPEGQEFATAEGDFNFNGQHEDEGLAIGTQLNIWTWIREAAPVQVRKVRSMPDSEKSAPVGGREDASVTPCPPEPTKPAAPPGEVRLIRRVPLPTSSAQLLRHMQVRMSQTNKKPPNGVLWSAMERQQTDWVKAKGIARRILDPKYTLCQFNDDLSAFPELNLYLLEERVTERGDANMSSGRTIGDEYQRTIGAFFAIYWLMRIDIDGQDGFSCGVDESWSPVANVQKEDLRVTQPDKRLAFKDKAKWDFFKKLLTDAGLIEQKVAKGVFKTTSKLVVNEKRLVSLLALTAIHDIMKMRVILPEVQIQHAPYHGYASSDVIGDHDHALSYVMENFSSILPSFRDLDGDEKRSVQFTQCNLCFNHGWFVQAEAPPGAIFTKFREALIRDHKSLIGQQDVALYFVHWLTDLAGAEPTPLAGCEKFVTKFPLAVLNSFLRSFEFVGKIATNTETEVMEEYLKMRWAEAEPPLDPQPTGDSAIARMRLLCMAQTNAPAVLKAFDKIPDEDRELLSLEMARTGVMGQSYSADIAPAEATEKLMGPAFLVYYGPAFLQNLGNDSAAKRLVILAEIYRCSRALWPASIAKASASVTIRVDVIKTLSSQTIAEISLGHDCWMLVKHNESEAFVERSSKRKLNKMIASGQQFQVLDLSRIGLVP